MRLPEAALKKTRTARDLPPALCALLGLFKCRARFFFRRFL
jgi:hypothetical protein